MGTVLDAGTGKHSLKWLSGLNTQRWTAVTGDINRARALQSEIKPRLRPNDKICVGNWLDDTFLNDETFDMVIADYLLGAIDGFAPYFQSKLFRRLKRHVSHTLYVVGLEPLPPYSPDPAGKLITDITNLRDAHIKLANHRCYREYPMTWVCESLHESGFEVMHTAKFPIRYNAKKINSQLNVCLNKLNFIADQQLVSALRNKTESLRKKSLHHIRQHGPISFGFDYVIAAKPKQP